MKWIRVSLVVAVFLQSAYVPCQAVEPLVVTGEEIARTHYREGEIIEIVYRDQDGEQKTVAGPVKKSDDDGLTIGQGLWKERIAYDRIIQVTRPGVLLSAGDRVRVRAASVLVGTVASADRDTLTLESESGGAQVFPWSSVTRLEMSRQSSRAGIGAAVGLVTGIVAGFAAAAPPGGRSATLRESLKRMWFIPLGMLVGFALGVKIGKAHRSEKWRSVPLDKIRLGFHLQDSGRLALSTSIGF